MNNIYLKEPDINDKNNIIEMIEEVRKYDNNTEGMGSLDKALDDYNSFLQKCNKFKNKELISENLSTQNTFLLYVDNRLIGTTQLRHELKGKLLDHGGNIGYFIRPCERGKGYGNKILELAILEAKKYGLDKVLVTARIENITSNNVIKKNGGILENTFYDADSNNTYNRYWIKL